MAKSVLLYWGMGLYWGHAVSQNAKGHLIGHVKVGEDPGLALSPFSLKDPDPLIAWELQRDQESVKYVLPPLLSAAQRSQ